MVLLDIVGIIHLGVSFHIQFFYDLLDISDLDSILKKSLFWNVNKPAVVSFNRADFHGDTDISLDDAVRNTIENRTGSRPRGKIRMLAHLRYFGYCF